MNGILRLSICLDACAVLSLCGVCADFAVVVKPTVRKGGNPHQAVQHKCSCGTKNVTSQTFRVWLVT